jgi:hypothetical protein
MPLSIVNDQGRRREESTLKKQEDILLIAGQAFRDQRVLAARLRITFIKIESKKFDILLLLIMTSIYKPLITIHTKLPTVG